MKVTFYAWKDHVPQGGISCGRVLYHRSRKWCLRLWSLYLSVEFDNGQLTFTEPPRLPVDEEGA